jgi:hypothetical protein
MSNPQRQTLIDICEVIFVLCFQTAKLKAEARIECLRTGGGKFMRIAWYFSPHIVMTKLCSFVAVNVDEWMQEVDNLSVQDMPRSASSLSIRTDASGTGVSCFIHGLDSEVNSLVHSVL